MTFAALERPWLAERVLADDRDVLVVDKPPGIVVHGGDERLPGDVITRLSTLLRRRSDDDYLGVHQRLDKDASGVLLFVRRRELNPGVSEDIQRHRADKVYVAAVSDPGLAAEGVLEHRLETGKDGRTRVARRGGKLARSGYRVRERRAGRALVELRPSSGRTHQLRVQLAASGAPIGGDRSYGGAPAERLLLHAAELELPSLGRRFSAPVPERFAGWVRGEPPRLGGPEPLARAVADAVCLRWPLAAHASAYRLVNELGDGVPGVVVDRYADWVVLALSSDEAVERRRELESLLVELGARGVYTKLRVRADLRHVDVGELAPAEPSAGEPAPDPLAVREEDVSFRVSLGDGMSTGLFVDQRDNRALVRTLARGARVLNLFSYTCSFSVAAALGGASEVVSVDLSGRALERGRDNFRDNGLDPDRYRSVRADAMKWLARARRGGQRFALVVLDPPSFGTGASRAFSMARDYRALAADALALLEPGGRLLAVTNHRKTTRERLRKLLREAAGDAGRRIRQLKDLASALDCPPAWTDELPSKSVLVTVE